MVGSVVQGFDEAGKQCVSSAAAPHTEPTYLRSGNFRVENIILVRKIFAVLNFCSTAH